MDSSDLLTPQENECLKALAEIWNRFLELPVLHDWDRVEFMHAIHICQNVVSARPCLRTFNKAQLQDTGTADDIMEVGYLREGVLPLFGIPPFEKAIWIQDDSRTPARRLATNLLRLYRA